jgi:hypothetical protein
LPNTKPRSRLTREKTLRHEKPSFAWPFWCSGLLASRTPSKVNL